MEDTAEDIAEDTAEDVAEDTAEDTDGGGDWEWAVVVVLLKI
jgi:hypothetical protein